MKNLFSQVMRGTFFVSFFSTVHASELEIKPTFEATLELLVVVKAITAKTYMMKESIGKKAILNMVLKDNTPLKAISSMQV